MDSATILRQISSFKDMLDQVNEEIEQNIQKTRDIESEIVKHSEIEKGCLMRESELTKMVSIRDFELNGLIQVTATAATALELMQRELGCLKVNLDGTTKRISDKREQFIVQCGQFQSDIIEGENEELHLLSLEKEALENERYNLNMKISALQNSTKEFIEEILEEIHNSIFVLEAELQHGNSKYIEVLKDINDLKFMSPFGDFS